MFAFINRWLRRVCGRVWQARRAFGVRCFALVCLVIFGTPFLRTCFQVQNLRTLTMASGLVDGNSKRPPAFSIDRLHALNPDDHDVELAYAEGEDSRFYETDEDDVDTFFYGSGSRMNRTAIERYGNLMKKWPRHTVPVARWLSHTANSFRDVRVAGVLEEPNPAPSPPVSPPPASPRKSSAATTAPTPKPERTPPPTPTPVPAPTPSYTPAELNHAIAVAQSGQKLEPQNSYFGWTLIYFLLCARRDDEAIRVLDAASRQPRYDDHSCDVLAAFIRAREKVRPTLVEEKWADVIYGQTSFAKHRHIAHLFSWLAWQKDRAGDVQGALSIRGNLARMSQLVGNNRRISWSEDFSRPISSIAWRRDLRPLQLTTRFSRTSWRTQANDFADYATAHNRPEIARETRVFVQKMAARQQLYRNYNSTLSSRVLIYIGLGAACLLSIAFFVALYIELSVLLLLSPPVEVERRDVWTLAPVLALTALVGIFCLRFAIAHFQAKGYSGFELSKETASTLWLMAIGAVLLFITPLLLSALWCALASWRRAKKAPETKTAASGLKIMRHVQFFVWGNACFYAITYSVVAAVMAGQGAAAWSIKLPALGEIYFNEPWWNLPLIWFLVAVFSLLNWFFYARIFAAPPRKYTLYALRRFRQTLLALVPIYSVLWVLIALLSLPQRRLAETQLNDLLQHGEVYVAQHPDKYR